MAPRIVQGVNIRRSTEVARRTLVVTNWPSHPPAGSRPRVAPWQMEVGTLQPTYLILAALVLFTEVAVVVVHLVDGFAIVVVVDLVHLMLSLASPLLSPLPATYSVCPCFPSCTQRMAVAVASSSHEGLPCKPPCQRPRKGGSIPFSLNPHGY